MTAPLAFSGDYVDLKFIKSRKCAQIYIEIPIEQAAAFVATFGTPNPATGVPVALARLQTAVEKPEREKRKFSDLPPAQQAAMRCQEPGFWRFMVDRTGKECVSSESAASLVRWLCSVNSRSDLNTDSEAARLWRDTDIAYENWQRGIE